MCVLTVFSIDSKSICPGWTVLPSGGYPIKLHLSGTPCINRNCVLRSKQKQNYFLTIIKPQGLSTNERAQLLWRTKTNNKILWNIQYSHFSIKRGSNGSILSFLKGNLLYVLQICDICYVWDPNPLAIHARSCIEFHCQPYFDNFF